MDCTEHFGVRAVFLTPISPHYIPMTLETRDVQISTFQSMRREISKPKISCSGFLFIVAMLHKPQLYLRRKSPIPSHVPFGSTSVEWHFHFQEFARVSTVGDKLFTCRSVACEAIRVIVFKWQNLTPYRIRQVCFVLSLSRTTCFDPYPPAWKKKGGLSNWKGVNGSMHRGSLAAVRVYIVCGKNKCKFWLKKNKKFQQRNRFHGRFSTVEICLLARLPTLRDKLLWVAGSEEI